MKLKTVLIPLFALGWLCLGLVSTSLAGLTLKYDAADLNQAGPGPLAVDVGVLVTWDGVGDNVISGLDFDVNLPGAVTLPDGNLSDPLQFGVALVTANAVSFLKLAGDVAPLIQGDTLLTTLRFEVADLAGDFPIGITVVNANKGSPFANNVINITNQVSSVGGTLSVSAVPEPSSLALLGVASLAGFGWRRRRCS